MTTNHLTDVECVDLLDGVRLGATVDEHVRGCPQCRTRVEDMRAVVRMAQGDAVPEPSPLFWEHLARRVKGDVEAGESPDEWWRLALPGWRGQLVAAAVAVVVIGAFAVESGRWLRTVEPPDPQISQVSDLRRDDQMVALEERAEWALLVMVADGITSDEAGELGLVGGPGHVDRMLDGLSDDERRRLGELLQDELSSTES